MRSVAQLRAALMPLGLTCLAFGIATAPAAAQVHGIPASATSISDGRIVGIPASVTSIGPNGFTTDDQALARGDFRHQEFGSRLPGRHHNARQLVPVGVGYPVYVFPEDYEARPAAEQDAINEVVRQAVSQPSAEPQKIIVEIRDTREQKSSGSGASSTKAEAAKPEAARTESATELAAENPPEKTPEKPIDKPKPVTLIFRDGHQQQVTDYAIMGESLFDLADGGARKIPLDQLDIPATRKINEQHGIDLQLPQASAPAPAIPSAQHLTSAR